MSIKFLCPHCKKVLSVKDQFAGKKAKCPQCTKVLTVPSPQRPAAFPATPRPAAPPVDTEAAAAALLADEPKADGLAAAPTAVDFECPMCGEKLHMPLDLAGKRAPCPECKRIIKVPEPEKKDPTNWRQVNQSLPSAARRPEEKPPEGAWSSAAGAAMVSRESLQDAGAIPEARALLTVRQRVVRYTWIAGAAIFAVVCVVLGYLKWAEATEARALDAALGYAESAAGQSELGRDGRAAVHRLAGEYALRRREAGVAAKAREEFEKSLGLLRPAAGGPAAERDELLRDLAVAWVGMGGSPQEADDGFKMKWDDVQKELHAALGNMRYSEARINVLRDLARLLAAQGQGERATALASSLYPAANEERAEALGAVGLELLAAHAKGLPEKAADQALQPYAAVKDRPPLAPSAVALAVALGRDPPEPGKKGSRWEVVDKQNEPLGRAEGLARKGDWAQARQTAESAPEETRFPAYVALAAASLDNKGATDDVAAALTRAPATGFKPTPWLLLRLARIGERAGSAPDAVRSVAALIPDADLRGRAQLAALKAQLSQTKAAADPKLLDGVDAQTLSARLAREEWARHNIRYSSGTPGVVRGWDAPNKAFGQLGVALGSQGGE